MRTQYCGLCKVEAPDWEAHRASPEHVRRAASATLVTTAIMDSQGECDPDLCRLIRKEVLHAKV